MAAGTTAEAEDGALTEGAVLFPPEGAVAPVGALPAEGLAVVVGLETPVGAVLLLPDGATDAVGDPAMGAATGAATGEATGAATGAGSAGKIRQEEFE